MRAGSALVVRADARRLPLSDESVDLVVTSPPYFALRSYTDGGEHYSGQVGSEATPAEWLGNLLECTREMARVLKPSGSIFVDLGDAFSRGQRYDSEFTVEDAAWLGGVLDSDGSISVHRQGTSYTAWTRVGQMRPEVVHRIHQVTGIGQVFQDKRGVWNWNAAAQQASAVLARVWPWLHIKRRQALAAVELQSRKAAVGGKGRWNALTDEELRHRERIRTAVLNWNSGVVDDYEPPLLPLPDLPLKARWMPTKSLMLLPERFRLACVDELGLIARAVIIWSKSNGLPESVTDRVRRSHEDWVHLVKQPRYFSAIDEIREGYSDNKPWGAAQRGPGKPSIASAVVRGTDPTQQQAGLSKNKERVENPLGKLPGSVWEIPTEPLVVPAHLGVDHFAAFAMEWPRRLVLGWSPSGICVECGEGRRPATLAHYVDAGGRGTGEKFARVDQGHGDTRQGSFKPQEMRYGRANRSTTVTGYVCACTPYTDHPGSGESSGPRYADAVSAGGYPSTGRWPNLAARPRVGPWREYHFDAWTPPPTRPAVVLDPFGGTGTTALVASVLGRVGISVDMSADYCQLARWRVADPGERAKAMRVAKPPPVPEDQLSLFPD